MGRRRWLSSPVCWRISPRRRTRSCQRVAIFGWACISCGLYRPLARTCAAVAVGCLAVGAARPAPLILGLALIVLLSIPWGLAVAHRAQLSAAELTDGQAGS